jgi:hypothetical protein
MCWGVGEKPGDFLKRLEKDLRKLIKELRRLRSLVPLNHGLCRNAPNGFFPQGKILV